MSWFQLEAGFRDHPKLKKLASKLNISHNEAKGMVASLWCWCLDHAVDGDLSSFDSWDIADASGWDADPSVLVRELLALRLLDTTEHGLAVHEWMDRAGSFREALRKRKSREKKRLNVMSRDCPVTVPSTCDDVSDKEDREDRQRGEDREEKQPLSSSQKTASSTARDVDQVVAHYQTHHGRSRPGAKEKKKIRERLKEGYSVADLCKAIDGCHLTPHNTGDNERNQTYLELELIMRTSSHVARYLENADRFRPGSEASIKSGMAPKTRRTTEALQRFLERGEQDENK